MQINPQEILDREIVIPSEFSQVQQVGIDLSLKYAIGIAHGYSVNIDFNESIKLPDDIYALFVQRSSFSRKGIFVTTGVYDPGYEGSLGCTVYNMSGRFINIPENERIGQLICYKADAASSYNGQYQKK